jgi:hypothetical protein
MSSTILQINLRYTCSAADLKASFVPAAEPISQFPGLVWKVWIINNETQEAGGIYCFKNPRAVDAYINSPIIAGLRANPLVANIDIKTFAAIESLTAITRGPVPIVAEAS